MTEPVEEFTDTIAKLARGGRYTDFLLLGVGGFGHVFRAKDNSLDKAVAIKLLKSNVEVKAIVRFQQEAKVLSRLNHPYIVKVLDFHHLESRDLYLIMEHVEGQSLHSRLEKGGPIPATEALRLCVQLCEGLDHAHANGVVHRDLTPRNVIIDETNNVRILDFGIAKLLEDSDMFGALTKADGFIGSPLYMSPEQILGSDIDARSDIYSLGILLYCMLTGHAPFEAEGIIDLLEMRKTLPPPSVAEFVQPPELGIEIDKVLSKALQPDPDDRYPSMFTLREVFAELIEEFTGKKVETVAPAKYLAARKEHHPLAILASFALIAFSAFIIWQSFMPKEVPKMAPVAATSDVVGADHGWGYRGTVTDAKGLPEGFESIVPKGEEVTFWQAPQKLSGREIVNRLQKKEFEYLSLSDNKNITDKDIANLVPFRLKGLNIVSTNCGDSVIPIIAKMDSLEMLYLDHLNITNRGIKQLAPLKNLKALYVDSCEQIGDDAVKFIVSAFPDLEVLHLGGTQVTNQGAKELGRLHNLRRLWVCETKVNDDGLAWFDKFNLGGLDLSLTGITDVTLKRLNHMTRLAYLEVSGCKNITDEGIRPLQARIPNLRKTPIMETFEKDPDSLELFKQSQDIE